MEDNKTYFGEIGHGLKTLAIGMKTTWKEYFKDFFTNKSTEQYPENRKTTLHVAKRHRGRLTFKRNEDGSYKCTACTLCEILRQARRRRCSTIISTTWATACSASSVRTPATSMLSSLPMISRTLCSTVPNWCFISTKRSTRAVRCLT